MQASCEKKQKVSCKMSIWSVSICMHVLLYQTLSLNACCSGVKFLTECPFSLYIITATFRNLHTILSLFWLTAAKKTITILLLGFWTWKLVSYEKHSKFVIVKNFLLTSLEIKYLTNLVFSVRTVNYGLRFFPIDLWPKPEARGP